MHVSTVCDSSTMTIATTPFHNVDVIISISRQNLMSVEAVGMDLAEATISKLFISSDRLQAE